MLYPPNHFFMIQFAIRDNHSPNAAPAKTRMANTRIAIPVLFVILYVKNDRPTAIPRITPQVKMINRIPLTTFIFGLAA